MEEDKPPGANDTRPGPLDKKYAGRGRDFGVTGEMACACSTKKPGHGARHEQQAVFDTTVQDIIREE